MGLRSAPTVSQTEGGSRGCWTLSEGSSPVSLQGAALKYLPSILEDVFGIFDSSALG